MPWPRRPALQQSTWLRSRTVRGWAANGQMVNDRPVARIPQRPGRVVGSSLVDAMGSIVAQGIEGRVKGRLLAAAATELRASLNTAYDSYV